MMISGLTILLQVPHGSLHSRKLNLFFCNYTPMTSPNSSCRFGWSKSTQTTPAPGASFSASCESEAVNASAWGGTTRTTPNGSWGSTVQSTQSTDSAWGKSTSEKPDVSAFDSWNSTPSEIASWRASPATSTSVVAQFVESDKQCSESDASTWGVAHQDPVAFGEAIKHLDEWFVSSECLNDEARAIAESWSTVRKGLATTRAHYKKKNDDIISNYKATLRKRQKIIQGMIKKNHKKNECIKNLKEKLWRNGM
jgi:hypothetical protein